MHCKGAFNGLCLHVAFCVSVFRIVLNEDEEVSADFAVFAEVFKSVTTFLCQQIH